MWRKGNPSALLAGMQTGVATVESSMELFSYLNLYSILCFSKIIILDESQNGKSANKIFKWEEMCLIG